MLTVNVWVCPGWIGGFAGIVGAPAGEVIWRPCVSWPVFVTTNVTVPQGIVVREKLNFGGTIVTVTVVAIGWLHAELVAGVVVVEGLEDVVVEGRMG
jgi:hypothetical protein